MRRVSCGRPTTWTTGSVSIPHLLHFIFCACAGEAVEGQLPGQCQTVYPSLLTFNLLRMRRLSCGRPTTWTTGSVSIPHFLRFIYYACADEAVEGQLSGQLEMCLSITSYISIIAHAQVKLWKANYLDNWKCVYPSLLTFYLLRMRRWSCGRQTIWTTGQCLSVYPLLLTFHLLLHVQLSCGWQTIWTTGKCLWVSFPHFLHLIYYACAG